MLFSHPLLYHFLQCTQGKRDIQPCVDLLQLSSSNAHRFTTLQLSLLLCLSSRTTFSTSVHPIGRTLGHTDTHIHTYTHTHIHTSYTRHPPSNTRHPQPQQQPQPPPTALHPPTTATATATATASTSSTFHTERLSSHFATFLSTSLFTTLSHPFPHPFPHLSSLASHHSSRTLAFSTFHFRSPFTIFH